MKTMTKKLAKELAIGSLVYTIDETQPFKVIGKVKTQDTFKCFQSNEFILPVKGEHNGKITFIQSSNRGKWSVVNPVTPSKFASLDRSSLKSLDL